MNLPKAIEILDDLDSTLPQTNPEERREAVKLGKESLKRFLLARSYGVGGYDARLPSETIN